MLEHYSTIILLGDTRHAEMLEEARLLRIIPRRKRIVICRICRVLGGLFIRTGEALLDVVVDTAEAAK